MTSIKDEADISVRVAGEALLKQIEKETDLNPSFMSPDTWKALMVFMVAVEQMATDIHGYRAQLTAIGKKAFWAAGGNYDR